MMKRPQLTWLTAITPPSFSRQAQAHDQTVSLPHLEVSSRLSFSVLSPPNQLCLPSIAALPFPSKHPNMAVPRDDVALILGCIVWLVPTLFPFEMLRWAWLF